MIACAHKGCLASMSYMAPPEAPDAALEQFAADAGFAQHDGQWFCREHTEQDQGGGAADKPTCWVLFPVYDIPQSAIAKLDASGLASAFSETVTDAFQHASWGDATVLAADPRLAHSDETAKLVQALRDVVNPIAQMQRNAEAEGARLSGMAYSIANDVGHVQSIARRALAEWEKANG